MKESYTLDISDVSVSYLSDELTSNFQKISCHDRYEVLYVVSGEGRCVIEGNEYTVSPRSLFITSPFEYKSVYIDGKGVFSRYTVSFSLSSLIENSVDILNKLLDKERGFHFLAVEQNRIPLSVQC